jgi:hypothetical protein
MSVIRTSSDICYVWAGGGGGAGGGIYHYDGDAATRKRYRGGGGGGGYFGVWSGELNSSIDIIIGSGGSSTMY